MPWGSWGERSSSDPGGQREQGQPGGPLPEQETEEEEEEGQRMAAGGWGWRRPSCLAHMVPRASLRTHPSRWPRSFLFPHAPLGNILGW